MTPLEKVATSLNGINYREPFQQETVQFAKDNNLAIFFAVSDDLMEVVGAMDDEYGAYEGFDYEDIEDEYVPYLNQIQGMKLKLYFNEYGTPDWKFEVGEDVEFKPFNILRENDEVQCEGIVVNLEGGWNVDN